MPDSRALRRFGAQNLDLRQLRLFGSPFFAAATDRLAIPASSRSRVVSRAPCSFGYCRRWQRRVAVPTTVELLRMPPPVAATGTPPRQPRLLRWRGGVALGCPSSWGRERMRVRLSRSSMGVVAIAAVAAALLAGTRAASVNSATGIACKTLALVGATTTSIRLVPAAGVVSSTVVFVVAVECVSVHHAVPCHTLSHPERCVGVSPRRHPGCCCHRCRGRRLSSSPPAARTLSLVFGTGMPLAVVSLRPLLTAAALPTSTLCSAMVGKLVSFAWMMVVVSLAVSPLPQSPLPPVVLPFSRPARGVAPVTQGGLPLKPVGVAVSRTTTTGIVAIAVVVVRAETSSTAGNSTVSPFVTR